MSIFDNARHKETYRTVEDRIRPAEVTMSIDETGKVDFHGFATRNEYKLVLSVEQNFWANSAQLDGARSYALRAAAAFLYGDVLRHMDHLANAIASGDRDEALDTILLMKREMQP